MSDYFKEQIHLFIHFISGFSSGNVNDIRASSAISLSTVMLVLVALLQVMSKSRCVHACGLLLRCLAFTAMSAEGIAIWHHLCSNERLCEY